MAVQGNILAFDEAKRNVGKARPSAAASKTVSKKPTKRNSAKFNTGSMPKQSASSKSGAKQSSAASRPSAKKSSAKIVTTNPSRRASTSTKASNTNPGRSTTANKPKTVSTKAKASSSNKKAATKKPAAKNSKQFTQKKQDTQPTKSQNTKKAAPKSSAKISRFSEAKRNLSRSKASKEFTKQFGDTTSSAASSGPRAAVYKGEMGRQHKKMTTKMQGGSSAGKGFGGFSFVGFDWRNSTKLLASVAIVFCIALSGAFLYPAAQQYYVTVRENDRVQAEYLALQERNNEIQAQVNMLSSDEGIEDKARQEFGWVKEGENSVTVYGLDLEKEEVSYTQSIPSGSVEAPDTWYSPILDLIFGVE